jgi:hypothetical protein
MFGSVSVQTLLVFSDKQTLDAVALDAPSVVPSPNPAVPPPFPQHLAIPLESTAQDPAPPTATDFTVVPESRMLVTATGFGWIDVSVGMAN